MEVARTLFNHKPALHKEIQYLINCFENTLFKEKIVFEELEKSSKNLGEQVVPSCISLLDESLEDISLKGNFFSVCVYDCLSLLRVNCC